MAEHVPEPDVESIYDDQDPALGIPTDRARNWTRYAFAGRWELRVNRRAARGTLSGPTVTRTPASREAAP